MRLLLTLTSSFFFFVSISSIALGILALMQHVLEGLWLLAGGLFAELIALIIALLAGISKATIKNWLTSRQLYIIALIQQKKSTFPTDV